MSGSGVLREKKQESVQFWLAIGAISLLFHALLIVGLKRWVTIAVVDESDPISVEFVDPSSDAAPEGEPIVQAAAMKPEAKPEVKPEVQPEPEPEIKAEVQPEPIVQPEVKKVEPAIVPKPKKKPKLIAGKDSQPKSNDGPKSVVKPLDEPPPEILPEPPPGGGGNGVKSVSFKTVGLPKLSRQSQAELKGTATLMVPVMSAVAVPPTFPLRPGESMTLKLSFYVDNKTGKPDSPTLPKLPNLDDKAQEKLGLAIAELFRDLTFAPPQIIVNGGAGYSESSEWELVFQLTGL